MGEDEKLLDSLDDDVSALAYENDDDRDDCEEYDEEASSDGDDDQKDDGGDGDGAPEKLDDVRGVLQHSLMRGEIGEMQPPVGFESWKCFFFAVYQSFLR